MIGGGPLQLAGNPVADCTVSGPYVNKPTARMGALRKVDLLVTYVGRPDEGPLFQGPRGAY